MSNEKSLRCIQQNLSMNESAPVCQHWSYASDHPMAKMLQGRYFLSAHDRLRPGDTIRIVQMEDRNIHARDNTVVAIANVTIIKVGKVNVDMHIDRMVVLSELAETVDATEEVGTGTVSGDATEQLRSATSSLQDGQLEIGKRIDAIEEFIAETNSSETIDTLVEELKSSIATLEETQTRLLADITAFKQDGEPEGLDTLDGADVDINSGDEVPVIKWNPGKKRHEAVAGEGESEKVLFSNKDKKKVEKWLESITGPNK